MDEWRTYLESSGFDFWTICERALTLAYLDNPVDFPSRRDKLAQKLFAPEKLDPDTTEDQVPLKTPIKTRQPPLRQNKAIASSNDGTQSIQSPCYANYDEAEALTEEMEEENLLKRDVFGIKETLLDSYKSEREIFDSLQRLVFMQLSFDVLKETEIGKTVNSLRKHSSSKIRGLVRKLVSEWKDTANHWYKSVEDVTAAARAEEGHASAPDEDEDGLPSPPLDEGALLAGRTESIEMSQLFDFMEEDMTTGSGSVIRGSNAVPSWRANDLADSMNETSRLKDRQKHPVNKNESDAKKKEKDLVSVTCSNGHTKRDKDDFLTNGHDSRPSSIDKVEKKMHHHEATDKEICMMGEVKAVPSKPQLACCPELDQRLQAAKRKLHENYHQAEIAKRQRTIQVMELQNLPKGGPKRAKAPQPVHGKPLSQHRLQGFTS